MKSIFYNAIYDHVSTHDETKVHGIGSAAEECENVYRNKLSLILDSFLAIEEIDYNTVSKNSISYHVNEIKDSIGADINTISMDNELFKNAANMMAEYSKQVRELEVAKALLNELLLYNEKCFDNHIGKPQTKVEQSNLTNRVKSFLISL
jgi:hypothetical protein